MHITVYIILDSLGLEESHEPQSFWSETSYVTCIALSFLLIDFLKIHIQIDEHSTFISNEELIGNL